MKKTAAMILFALLTMCLAQWPAGATPLVGLTAAHGSAAPGHCHLVSGTYPDPACTPGAVSPRVTQSNLNQTVCSHKQYPDPEHPGQMVSWNRHERATYLPTPAATARKQQMLAAYNVGPANSFELDHRVPISVGGDPSAVANTYPQPWNGPHGAHAKDTLEQDTWHKLCAGQITLAQAQAQFLGISW